MFSFFHLPRKIMYYFLPLTAPIYIFHLNNLLHPYLPFMTRIWQKIDIRIIIHTSIFLTYYLSFNLAKASAKALFLKSSCCFKYLFTSFFETRLFCCCLRRFSKVANFSRCPQVHVNVWPSPSPNNFKRFLQLGQRAFVFL